MNDIKKQGFVTGASILLGSMIVVKIIGALFKIPIGNILTPVGMAYFNTSYQLFTTVYALTVTGFSSATARMVASFSAQGQHQDCKRTLALSQVIFILLGVAGALLMLLFSSEFAQIVKMPGAQYAMMAMAPAILFSCMMAAYRGYYEGLRNMTPTAVSQIVEVSVKLVLGVTLSYAVIEYARRQFFSSGMVFGVATASVEDAISISLPYAAAAAMIAISVSTLAGYLYMVMRFQSTHRGYAKQQRLNSPAPAIVPGRHIINQLLITALPITLSAVALNLTNMIDVVTITSRLKSIYALSPSYFDALYGKYLSTGQNMHEMIYGSYTYALPFFSIVSAFTALFGKSALPNVTAAFVRQDCAALRSNIESVLRMTALIAFPAGIGLSVLSEQIIFLFHGNVSGSVSLIAPSLRVLGVAAIFLGFTCPIYAIFQGVGKLFLPLIFVVSGGMIKIIVNYYLIGITEVNILGAAYGSLACYALIVLLSMICLGAIAGVRLNYLGIFCKPAIAAGICGITAWYVSGLFSGNTGLIIAVILAGLSYLLTIVVIRAIPRHEILMLPKGEKLASFLAKLGLLSH